MHILISDDHAVARRGLWGALAPRYAIVNLQPSGQDRDRKTPQAPGGLLGLRKSPMRSPTAETRLMPTQFRCLHHRAKCLVQMKVDTERRPGSSWRRSTERFGSTSQGYNPPSRGLSQYLQGRSQRNKKRRTLADMNEAAAAADACACSQTNI